MKRVVTLIASATLALGSLFVATSALAQNVPPAPPPLTSTPAPTPTPVLPPGALPSPGASPATVTVPIGGDKPQGEPTPKPDTNRVGISGVWEVQLQSSTKTTYTHFKLTQSGSVLTGTYLDATNKKFPLAGSVDGKNVRVVVSMPQGSTLSFTGTVDNATDMIGMCDGVPGGPTPFTAAYRPKYNWLENINPMPGTGGVGP